MAYGCCLTHCLGLATLAGQGWEGRKSKGASYFEVYFLDPQKICLIPFWEHEAAGGWSLFLSVHSGMEGPTRASCTCVGSLALSEPDGTLHKCPDGDHWWRTDGWPLYIPSYCHAIWSHGGLMTSRIGRGKTGSQQALAECLLHDCRADWESSSLTHTVCWHPGTDTN